MPIDAPLSERILAHVSFSFEARMEGMEGMQI
jgi:hypothetical protein